MTKISNLEMSRAMAQRMIRVIASDSGSIVWTYHALERMELRGIDEEEVLKILRTGDVISDPYKDKGAWVCNVSKRLRGSRDATAVTAFKNEKGKLVIVTLMWEDL